MGNLRNGRAGAIVAILVVVAVAGYLAGRAHTRAGAAPEQTMLAASVPGGVVAYPSSWARTTTRALAGLPLSNTVTLAPRGKAGEGGLVAGRVPGGEPVPLPHSFLAQLATTPHGEVVDLIGDQAYRYTGVRLAGLGPNATLYALPVVEGGVTLLACYARSQAASLLRDCERIVASLTLAAQSEAYPLTPEPTYASRLGGAVAALDARRLTLRAQIGKPTSLATLRGSAGGLAAAFAAAAGSLSALEPPQAASRAQAALMGSLRSAREAYTALATAAANESEATLTSARARVASAETAVDGALEDFALLGYGRS